MNLFQAVKDNISVRQAAEYCGISYTRHGMAVCPFHYDKNPSLKLYDRRYYCFGCGAKGDAVDFVSNYLGIGAKDAAERLARHYGVNYGHDPPHALNRRPIEKHVVKNDHERDLRRTKHFWEALTNRYKRLRRWKAAYAPRAPDDEIHPLYALALHNLLLVEWVLDQFFEEDLAGKIKWIGRYGDMMGKSEKQEQLLLLFFSDI